MDMLFFDGVGRCINFAGDITVGDHVWLGHGVEVLKHSIINRNSIVGCKAVVSKQFLDSNVILAGIPAKSDKNTESLGTKNRQGVLNNKNY